MTAARDIRLKALWRDDPTEAPLTLDLRIDPASGAIVSHWDVFGAFDLDGARCRPFVLRRCGAIDFGVDSTSLWKTNLREVAIAVGARFKVQWNEADSGEYEIVKIATPGAKDGRI
jgi:hypothetical protein